MEKYSELSSDGYNGPFSSILTFARQLQSPPAKTTVLSVRAKDVVLRTRRVAYVDIHCRLLLSRAVDRGRRTDRGAVEVRGNNRHPDFVRSDADHQALIHR